MSKLVYSVLFVIHLCQNTFFPIGLGALAGGVSGVVLPLFIMVSAEEIELSNIYEVTYADPQPRLSYVC